MSRLRRRYGRARLSKFYNLEKEAREFDRFEFIARCVARETATAKGRELSNGMQVKRLGNGWTYAAAGLQATAGPVTADKLFEMIRRNDLGWYVRKCEELRAYALEGS